MDPQEIAELHGKFWKRGYGSVAADELVFIDSLIARCKPNSFAEIGMASGLSTGFIARFMDEQGGGSLLSLDHDDTFFGDPTQPNGFLVPHLYQGDAVKVKLAKFKISLDIHEFPGSFDMAFIDANHQHPWPAIDMMALYPRMSGPRMMIHHDLQLFQIQDLMIGIGPKYLYDQFPSTHRVVSDARGRNKLAQGGNIFAVDLNMNQSDFEVLLGDLFKLPWSLHAPLKADLIEKIRNVITRDYSETFLAQFDRCLKIYNNKERLRSGV